MRSDTLDDARQLFERAERETNPEWKFAALEEALDITDELRADPSIAAAKISFANNLRLSHLRQLLGQLVIMRNVQFDVWFNYIKLLLLRVEPEIDAILANDSSLRENHRVFKDLWKDELLEILRRA